MTSETITDIDALTAALSGLVGTDAIALAAQSELVTDQLYPDEREHIGRAISKRQAEFGTARVLARRALAAQGFPEQSLVPRANRAPTWPAQAVGSISHSHGFCAVVVGRAGDLAGIGLDLETSREVSPQLQAAICTPAELAWLQQLRQSAGEARWLDTLVFSAKEAFYKCQYALTQTYLGFQDVELHLDASAQTFRVAQLSDRAPQPSRLLQIRGRWCRLPGLLITLATLR
ncbi:MAG TPA: 4'-phosphopantetheinyl transferase superfamily protein [Steroidobacteraceae bacterium]|jgi:4'-phosphopantetheinyl transferase EntD|nr:4'-phosphopantetheinyl transferase superfamily protein [Steroidobacteraceae bacterium]